MKGYVINLDRQPERLHQFFQQPASQLFERVPAVDKKILELINDDALFFDTHALSNFIGRKVTSGEIACTLSHIRCWKKIALDPQIQDDDFALIAEDDIIFSASNNFKQIVQDINQVAKNMAVDIIILQALAIFNTQLKQDIYQGSGELKLIHLQPDGINNQGSSLYLIRKKQVKLILEALNSKKPYWLADQYTAFCDSTKIMRCSPLLGYIPENAPSDLEAEREIARKTAQ